MTTTHYGTLGVTPDAPPEVIQAAYRALARKHHPDVNNAASHDRIAAVNNAWRVLSDPALKRAYDASLRPAAATPHRTAEAAPTHVNVPPAPARVTGSAAGHAFTLTTRHGTIIGNEQWVDQNVTSRGGGGVTAFGFGYHRAPRVNTTNVPHQRIAVRLRHQDVFLDHAGSFIPVANGQQVEVVYGEASNKSPWPVAIVNRSAGHWHWLDRHAGANIVSATARLVDFILFACVVAALGAAAWFGYVQQANFLVWIGFFVLGLPFIVGGAFPLTLRTEGRITRAMGAAITRIALA